jgi:hypothetical protein
MRRKKKICNTATTEGCQPKRKKRHLRLIQDLEREIRHNVKPYSIINVARAEGRAVSDIHSRDDRRGRLEELIQGEMTYELNI